MANQILIQDERIVVRNNQIVVGDGPSEANCVCCPETNVGFSCAVCENNTESMPTTVSVTLPAMPYAFANCLQTWCPGLAGNYTLDQELVNTCTYSACFELARCDPFGNPLSYYDGIEIVLFIESTRHRVIVRAFRGTCASRFTIKTWQWQVSRSGAGTTCAGNHTLSYLTQDSGTCDATGTTVSLTI